MTSDLVLLKRSLKQRLASRSEEVNTLSGNARAEYLERFLSDFVRDERVIMPAQALRTFAEQVMYEVNGYGPLEHVLADPTVTDIMVNGPEDVYIERQGKIEKSRLVFDDVSHLKDTIDRIVAPLGVRVDESSPCADGRLPDGSRVNVIIPPLSLSGPVLTIRRFSAVPPGIDALVKNGTLTARMSGFLGNAVRLKKNIIISGGTGSGKTTLLNALSSFIPADERIVTIEDTAELRLGNRHVVRLESRPPNMEGKGEVTIRDLVRNALRMRPDRIIVGEARGGEALDMLQAMNTGHDGSISTVHANSSRDAIRRLEIMALMSDIDLPHRPVRELIAAAVDLVVHIARLPEGRRVVDISKVEEGENSKVTMTHLFRRTASGSDGDDAG